jgi:hypothetical protein
MTKDPPTDDVAGPATGPETLAKSPEEDSPRRDSLLFDEEAHPPAQSPPPDNVAELSRACERFVLTRFDVRLDYTQDTLSLVDAYVREARAELATKPEIVTLLQGAIGAYLGEVIRRTFGGSWFAEGEEDGWRVDLTRAYLTFNPIGMAREALLLQPQDGWHAYLETDPEQRGVLEARLARLSEQIGGVEEEEYFAPTTRFDVVAIAVDALRADMVARGVGDVEFGPEDYARR